MRTHSHDETIVSEMFQLDSIDDVMVYVQKVSDGILDFVQVADAPDLPEACHMSCQILTVFLLSSFFNVHVSEPYDTQSSSITSLSREALLVIKKI